MALAGIHARTMDNGAAGIGGRGGFTGAASQSKQRGGRSGQTDVFKIGYEHVDLLRVESIEFKLKD
jgi:hypothetical protein